MRKPKVSSSNLFQPLDLMLGSVGAVRILRTLALHGDVISATILAKRTKLNRRGISDILDRLAAAGIIENVASVGKVSFRLVANHGLAPTLIGLFQAEASRAPELYSSLEKIGKRLAPELKAIWLFGSTARKTDTSGSDIDLAFVFKTKVSKKINDDLLENIISLGEHLKLRLSPAIMNISELHNLRHKNKRFRQALLDDGIPVYGPAPVELIDG